MLVNSYFNNWSSFLNRLKLFNWIQLVILENEAQVWPRWLLCQVFHLVFLLFIYTVTQKTFIKASFHHSTPLFRNLNRLSTATAIQSKSSDALPSEHSLSTSRDGPALAQPPRHWPGCWPFWVFIQGLLSWNALPSFSIDALPALKVSSSLSLVQ